MAHCLTYLFIVITFCFSAVANAQQGKYLSIDDFLNRSFDAVSTEKGQQSINESNKESSNYSAKTLWLNDDQQQVIKKILGHEYSGFRIRYWANHQKTAWVLEEIGKEHPITMGVVVSQQRIEKFSILEFRESRGWEIKYDFFTRQFSNVMLKNDKKDRYQLSATIDGITGATLSVRATKKIAKLALYLDQQVTVKDDLEVIEKESNKENTQESTKESS